MTKKLLLCAIAFCFLLVSFAGCGDEEAQPLALSNTTANFAVDPALIASFSMPKEDAVKELGLTEDMFSVTDEGPAYTSSYSWCGRSCDTYLVYNEKLFPDTAAYYFLMKETLPSNDDTKAFVQEGVSKFISQFGTPVCSTERDGEREGTEYTKGDESKILQAFWDEDASKYSAYSTVSFRFDLPESSESDPRWVECSFTRTAEDPGNLLVQMKLSRTKVS